VLWDVVEAGVVCGREDAMWNGGFFHGFMIHYIQM
jgi:hypothetical protein